MTPVTPERAGPAGAGAELVLDRIEKRFGDVPAIHDLSLRVPPGSFTALLGPSGCGKSTTLAVVAGLLDPDGGDVLLSGASLLGVPAERRPTSLVFQKPLLFPHLTVEQNVGFGLRMRRRPRSEIRTRVRDMLGLVQLADLGTRRVGELSGGQEQRVALARALVLDPRVLLLDEPFSQLDQALRHEMRTLVGGLHDATGVTTLFVTHDHVEAVAIADDVALMIDGRLEGHGTPESFYRRPPTLAAARFFGTANELPGTVSDGCFRSDAGLVLPGAWPDGPSVLVVRPEAVEVADAGLMDNAVVDGNVVDGAVVDGTVLEARFAGTHLAARVRLGAGQTVTVHVPVGGSVDIGGPIRLRVPAEACTVFAASPPASSAPSERVSVTPSDDGRPRARG